MIGEGRSEFRAQVADKLNNNHFWSHDDERRRVRKRKVGCGSWEGEAKPHGDR